MTMKKFILPIAVFAFLFLVLSSNIYAVPETTTPSQKSSNSYNPYCWNTHMIDEIAVCSRAFLDCVKPCVKMDLKANTACLNACSKVHTACLDSASAAYKVCIENERQAQKKPDAKQLESKVTQAPVKNSPENKGKIEEQSSNGTLPVFIGEWFKLVGESIVFNNWTMDTISLMVGGQTAQERKDTAKDWQYIDSLTDDYVFYVTGKTKDDLEDLIDQEPRISDEIVEQLKQKIQDSPFSLDILNGKAQIKYPGQNFWSDLRQGDKIPPGSTIFTGMDTTTVLSIKDKGVVQILPFTEVTISEEGLSESGKTTTDIDLNTGEIEVNIESGVYTVPLMQVNTINAVAGVRGTHFWVSYNKENNLSTVGVYEGKVEVTAKGNDRSIIVSPNGDKPGIVVVSQKLSVLKLILVGAVLIVIIGGVVLLLKSKRNKR